MAVAVHDFSPFRMNMYGGPPSDHSALPPLQDGFYAPWQPHGEVPVTGDAQHYSPIPRSIPFAPDMQTQAPPGVIRIRSSRACDACSERKVKCEDGPPCRQCLDLDLPCTFERPSRRRGPRNKCAEAIKKRKREDSSDPSFTTSSPSPSPIDSDVFMPTSVEAVCSLPLLSKVLDDYFACLHPLMPFPHERTFRQALSTKTSQGRSFVPLVASMVGCVVASSIPKAQGNLKALSEERMAKSGVPDSTERYLELAIKARGLGFLERTLSVDDAATSYFLGFINAKLSKWRQAELYFGECQNILRTLGFHKSADPGMSPQPSLPSSASGEQRPVLDHVVQETGRRIFWTMYLAASSTPALETFFAESIASTHVNMAQFPPLPTEADDAFIFPQQIVSPAAGTIPKMVGFNALARMAFAKNASTVAASNFDWNNQRQSVKQSLLKCYNIFNSLPLVLQIRSDATTAAFPWDCFFETSGLDSTPRGYGQEQQGGQTAVDVLRAEAFVSYLAASASLIDRAITLDEAIDASSKIGGAANTGYSPATTMAPFDQGFPSQTMYPAGQEIMPSFSPPMSGKFEYLPPTTPARTPDWNEHSVWTQREDVTREMLSIFGGLGRLNFQIGKAGTDLVGKLREIATTLLRSYRGDNKSVHTYQTEKMLVTFLNASAEEVEQAKVPTDSYVGPARTRSV